MGGVIGRQEYREAGITGGHIGGSALQEARGTGLECWLWHTLVYDLRQTILPLEASSSSSVKRGGSQLLPRRAVVGGFNDKMHM